MTFGATSRRYREGLCQRRDGRGNVATFQRVLLNNVATLDINVATLQRLLKINVTTFESHVATFQRVEKSTSRRWKSMSRHSKDTQNQRRNVRISRRDVPEKGKIDVATLRSNVATLQRRLLNKFHIE